MNNIEILSPAGDFLSLKSGVNNGANAIYLGAKELSARSSANNFSFDELKEAVSYCKKRNVKMYLTINTIFFDDEKEIVINVAKNAIEAGIDALIIQDLGVFYLLKDNVNIEFHSSTQMACHSLEGVKFLESLGFSRVVLARELSLDEIKYIVENSNIETEVFVHGALCMSVSGNCYVSSMIGTRSGNRGKCAQTCRLPFKVDNSDKEEYSLSLKDMSLIDYADQLRDIGVTSLKIEGRMKKPEYVAMSTMSLTNKLNGLSYDKDTLKNIFSRTGFTSGYANSDYSSMFGVRKKDDLYKQQEAIKSISKLDNTIKSFLDIDLHIDISLLNKIVVTGVCEEKEYKVYSTDVEPYKNKKITEEDIVKSFSKTGNTIFNVLNISYNINDDVFIKTSTLNELRRNIFQMVLDEKSKIKCNETLKVNDSLKKIKVNDFYFTVRFQTVNQIPFDLLDNIKRVHLPIDEVIKNHEKLKTIKEKIVVELYYTLFSRENDLKSKLKELKQQGYFLYEANNIAHINMLNELNLSFIAGFRLNIVNSYSCNFFGEFSCKNIIMSIEANRHQCENIKSPVGIGVVSYGFIPVMTNRVCPLKHKIGCKKCGEKHSLLDRMGNKFLMSCDSEVSFLFNSKPICLSDKLNDFNNIEFSHIYFTFEKKEYCYKVIKDHFNRANSFHNQSFTRGLFYRKVK